MGTARYKKLPANQAGLPEAENVRFLTVGERSKAVLWGRLLFSFCLIHLTVDGFADEAVQAFALTGGKVFNDLPFSFGDDHVDPVVGFFVVAGGSFFLGIGIGHNTSSLYT